MTQRPYVCARNGNDLCIVDVDGVIKKREQNPRDPEPMPRTVSEKMQRLEGELTAVQHRHWVRRRLAQVRMAASVNDKEQWP